MKNIFEKEITFLKHYCDEYDSGEVDYALEIAAKIRVLLHTTSYSTGLLAQYIVSSKSYFPQFYSYGQFGADTPDTGTLPAICHLNLCAYQIQHEKDAPQIATPVPLLEHGKRNLCDFSDW